MAAKKKPEPAPPSESESSGSGSEESTEDEAMESQTKSPVKKATVANSQPEVKPSGEESSGSSSEDDEGSEDDDSEDEAAPAAKPVKSSLPETSGDSAESGSGSDTESDHEATAKASVAAAVAKSDDGRKRVATNSETADRKPAKRVRASTPVSWKSREDDEIAILTGVSGYLEKGSDPLNDAAGFYEFVKESLNHHNNPEEVTGTLKRLKRRYQSTESNAKRGKAAVPNGGNRKTIFELSKTIWSKRKGGKFEDSAVTSPDRKKGKKMQGSNRKVLKFEPETEIERLEEKSIELVNGHLRKETANGRPGKNLLFSCWKELKNEENVGLKLMKEGLELLEPSMARRLEERWKKIEIAKLNILQKQRDLLQEQMELVLDALKQQRK